MMKLKLPDDNGYAKEYSISSNSVVIIGANGSGKSRLGAWIESQEPNTVHRISAQRSLTFNDRFMLTSYDEIYKKIFYGNVVYGQSNKFAYKWESKPTIKMLNDYDDVMAALFSKQAKDHSVYIKNCKMKELQGQPYDPTPLTDIDKLILTWKKIFPHRELFLEDAQILAQYDGRTYKGIEMSDGERVALYLLAQCLCVQPGVTIIIDEPEIHLHRSIMNKLWNEIELIRQDCIFIYITHDIQFASAHRHATKIWVKEFNGSGVWKWSFIEGSELPESCFLEILGSRKNVLFVEGTEESYDITLYRAVYPNYLVIPRGGCTEVINSVKAMNNNAQLHHLIAFGLIDRDYRPDKEIDELKKQNVFTLNIAEVENLFCIEEVLLVVESHLGFTPQEKVKEIKDYIVTRFSAEIESQILRAVASEVKFQLLIHSVPNSSIQDIENSINRIPTVVDINQIYNSIKNLFKTIEATKDYAEILRVFNQKNLTKSIGNYFGHKNNDYCELIIRLLKTDKLSSIVSGIIRYLPPEIPR